MKTQTKIITNAILVFLIIMILFGFLNTTLVYGDEKHSNTELLIVIDNSGSMEENSIFLNKVIDLIKLLADERGTDVEITYLVFNETAQIIDEFDKIQIISKKETCILQGIEAADQWMKEKIEIGKSVKVLFISDLFSSRYIEQASGKVQIYDIDTAKTEQEKITEIEGKWEEWCNEKKAAISIWTWESLCITEKKENTIDYLKGNNEEEITRGYQVNFEPVKNTIINNNGPENGKNENETDTEFIMQAIQSFEILMGSSDANWESQSYFINPGERRNLTLNNDEKLIYLFFPKANGVSITYDNKNVEAKYDGLYLLDKKEHEYCIVGETNTEQIEGFQLRIPDLKWEIDFSGVLKKQKNFTITLTPSESLSGSWGSPEDYSCILKILDKSNTEVCHASMEYDLNKGLFYLEYGISTSGSYTFICEVNGKEVVTTKRKVN